ncbi:MAG: hypothetical protein U0M72_05040 [Eggerthellaceae bacterium]
MRIALKECCPHDAKSVSLLVLLSLFGGCLFIVCGSLSAGGGWLAVPIVELLPECVVSSVIVALVLLLSDCIYLMFRSFVRSHTKDDASDRAKVFRWVAPCFGAKSLLIHSLVLVVAWLPWLIALYPGAMNWDAYYQITQCYPG